MSNQSFFIVLVLCIILICILGKLFSLDGYKSLKKKEDLLDCAIEMGDGDAILAITLMIRRTLNHPKFLAVISARPLAAQHLVNYMITRKVHVFAVKFFFL